MDELINELLETHLGRIIDQSRDELTSADELFQQDEADLSELEERYMALELCETDRLLIDDYIACIQTAAHRISDLSYIAGVRDTVRILRSLDLLEGMKN